MSTPRKQCAKCPWKISTNPHDIPDGYCSMKHAALHKTIAGVGEFNIRSVKVMACHETPVGKELPCVGWLDNQLGEGNNIGLRFAVMNKLIDANIETVGEQHSRFEDTLPGTKGLK